MNYIFLSTMDQTIITASNAFIRGGVSTIVVDMNEMWFETYRRASEQWVVNHDRDIVKVSIYGPNIESHPDAVQYKDLDLTFEDGSVMKIIGDFGRWWN